MLTLWIRSTFPPFRERCHSMRVQGEALRRLNHNVDNRFQEIPPKQPYKPSTAADQPLSGLGYNPTFRFSFCNLRPLHIVETGASLSVCHTGTKQEGASEDKNQARTMFTKALASIIEN